MSKISELKKFCMAIGVEFPDITIEQTHPTGWAYNVKWYNTVVISGIQQTPYGNIDARKEAVLIYVLVELAKWLKSEVNLLALLSACKTYMN